MTQRERLLERISIDPNVCFGKPCIRGHRIWVSLVLDWLASGESIEAILSDYPQLERDDVLACIAALPCSASRRGRLRPTSQRRFRGFVLRFAQTNLRGQLWIVERGRIREYDQNRS